MTPYAELHANGQFGEAGYNLLFELTRQELRLFPSLQPATGGDNAIWDVVGDFLVERGRGVSTMLLTSASDDESVGRLLRKSLRNWLIDRVRRTSRGALRRRLTRLISEDERFEAVPEGQPGAGRWRLAGTAGPPTGPPFATLRAAAWGIRDVRIPPWNSEERRAPIADEPSLQRIMFAVLTEAGGSLEPETVVAVFADRFPHALDPAEVPLTNEATEVADGLEASDPAQAVVDMERDDDSARCAEDIYAHLSAEERRLLPQLHGTVREQMRATGLRKSQTYLHIKALRERLHALLGDEEDRGMMASELLRLCGGPVDEVPDSRGDVPSLPGSR